MYFMCMCLLRTQWRKSKLKARVKLHLKFLLQIFWGLSSVDCGSKPLQGYQADDGKNTYKCTLFNIYVCNT